MNTTVSQPSQSEMAYRRVLSLAPCFSWVFLARQEAGTVSTVSTARQTVETVHRAIDLVHTQLKQGANESRFSASNGLRFFCGNEEPLLAERPSAQRTAHRSQVECWNPRISTGFGDEDKRGRMC
jgi:hypothetical protein